MDWAQHKKGCADFAADYGDELARAVAVCLSWPEFGHELMRSRNTKTEDPETINRMYALS
jgi:hypothetical protein